MNIIKRDGKEVEFKPEKISAAIIKANNAADPDQRLRYYQIQNIARKLYVYAANLDHTLSVEDVQELVETELMKTTAYDTAKRYIRYRYQRGKVRDAETSLLNYKDVVDNYLRVNDWRVKENSTVTYSVGGLILSNSGAITANYWLSEIYDKEVADAHRNSEIHLHDLSMLTGYCAGWSLKQLIQEGLGGVPGKITSSPASHLSTLCNQMVNFLGIMQNEWAGAQAFSSFDTYLAAFVKKDNLSYKEVNSASSLLSTE